jgi:D-glycero-beta-D-manno-heptose-7-phosphate kinase
LAETDGALIEKFKGKKICVIGDIIADVYIFGMPYKLSREAPVVVVKYEEEKVYPGSAGNTINNLLALGAHVYPLGCVGKDEIGQRLIAYFSQHPNIDMHGLLQHDGRTVTKTRILAGDTHTTKQQVIRIDREDGRETPQHIKSVLKQRLMAIGPDMDGLVFSDYEYGLIDREIVEYGRMLAKQKTVVGDSRLNLRQFAGFTLVTPNESEAHELAGLEGSRDVEAVGKKIMGFMELQALLITRGNKGMSLFLKGGQIHHIPISGGDEGADVTGAGDTVAAAATLALASGADFLTASRIANHAGGIVVMKRGTAVVTLDELRRAIEAHG